MHELLHNLWYKYAKYDVIFGKIPPPDPALITCNIGLK